MQTPVPQTEDEIIEWLNARGNGDPDENGISRDQLRENRRLTPLERLHQAERSTAGMLWLRSVGERHRAVTKRHSHA